MAGKHWWSGAERIDGCNDWWSSYFMLSANSAELNGHRTVDRQTDRHAALSPDNSTALAQSNATRSDWIVRSER